MPTFPKWDYGFNLAPKKENLADLFAGIYKLILKFIWKLRGSGIGNCT